MQRKSKMQDTWKQYGLYQYGLYLLCYTLLFLLLACLVFRPFYENGRRLIWDKDGLYQTFTTMAYYSQYWKDFFYNLFGAAGRPLSLPMVDFSIGLGFDVPTTLNHYGFGDILLLLSIPFERDGMEFCYGLIAILRFYLAGLTFSAYCIYIRRKYFPTLIGAFLYAFCGYALYAGVRHPYFLNSMIYFPLMLVGAEQVIRRRSGLLLTVTVGIAAGSNFYFMYMLTILTLLYALVRFFQVWRGEWKDKLLSTLLRGIGYYLLGIGLAAVFLFPSILAFLGNARTGIKAQFENSMLFYEAWFYKELLYGFSFPEFAADYWAVLSFAPVAVYGLVILFFSREGYARSLKRLFVIWTALLWVPLGGLVMNGFSYVSHRWIYGYGFLMAVIVVCALEKLPLLSVRQALYSLAALPALLAVACFAGEPGQEGTGAGLCLALLYGGIILCFPTVIHRVGRLWARQVGYGALLAVSCGSILINALLLYSPEHGNYVSQFHPAGQALAILEDCSEAAVVQMQKEKNMALEAAGTGGAQGLERVDGGAMDLTNQAMVMGYQGINGFFSIVSNDVYQYMKQLEMDNVKFPNWFYGFGGRAALNSLGCVKYFANNGGNDKNVLYGYEKQSDLIYENKYALPAGYAYENVIGESDFDKLDAVRKQQAMMQAVVIDGNEEARGAAPVYSERLVPYQIREMKNLEWNRQTGALLVGEGGGDLWLDFEGDENCETYLRFQNYDINDSGYELLTVNIECDEAYWKKFYEASAKSVWYGDFHNFIVNLGYTKNRKTQVHVNFPFEGEFKLEDLQIYCLPMADYQAQVEGLQAESLQEVTVFDNRISGKITVEGERTLLIAAPYSRGWKAFVDGRETEIKKANLMYMAVSLEPGAHIVQLKYRTPGLAAGAAAFLVSAVIVLVLFKNGYTNKKRI